MGYGIYDAKNENQAFKNSVIKIKFFTRSRFVHYSSEAFEENENLDYETKILLDFLHQLQATIFIKKFIDYLKPSLKNDSFGYKIIPRTTFNK